MANVMTVNDANFEAEVEKHEGLAVVDFGATWCGPCQVLAPIVHELAAAYAGRAKVATLDVDENMRTTARFNVRGVPTVLFFKNGRVVDSVVGAVPKATLEAKFVQHAA